MSSDEILFVIGIILTAVSFFVMIIVFVIYKMKKIKLKAALDKEYGEEI